MAAIYDARGKPIERQLTTEQATGSLTGVRSPYEDIVAPGLTPRRLHDLIVRATSGDHRDYLSLADEMEKRDANYFQALQTRKLAVAGLERTVEAASEDADDARVADAVKSWLFSPQFGRALLEILDATAKGFSVVEIVWAKRDEIWTPADFIFRPQRWFFFDNEYARELRLYDGSVDGEQLHAYKYVVHVPHVFSGSPLAGGLARIVAALHLFKGYAIKDWLAFAEVFGMPMRVGKYQESASNEQKDELKRAVRNIGSDAAAVIPATMEIEFLRANASGNAGSDMFFQVLASWCNREVNKAVLGSNMIDEDGGSFAKAVALNDLRGDLRNADAWSLANSLQDMIVRPFVDLNFGPRREDGYPLVNFDTSEPEDLEALARSLPPFIELGLPVSATTILEKFGLTMPEPGELMLQPRSREPAAPDGDAPDGDAPDGDAPDGDAPSARAAKLEALLARIARDAETTTNMRAFRLRLRDLVGSG